MTGPMGSSRISNRTTWIAFFLLLTVYAFLAVREMSLVGITIDERAYFQGGHIALNEGWTHRVTLYHGPLPYYGNQLFALPLPSGGLEAVADQREHIFWGRLGMLPFSLLAASVVFLWSRRAFGNLGGLFSMTLFTFHPLMIGYGGLLAVGMAHTGTALLCLYLLWRFVQRPTLPRCALTGVGLGIAFATKFLTVLLGPPVVVIAAVQAFRVRRRGEGGTTSRGLLAALGTSVAISALAIVTLHATYGFQVDTASTDPGDYRGEFLSEVVEMPVVGRFVGCFPAPYLRGLDFHLYRAEDLPFQPFLNGRYAPSHPTFYLWVFLCKTPEWLIALTAGLFFLVIPRWLRGRGSFAERSTMWVALPTGAVMLGFLSLFNDQQLGVRYILPLFGLLFILLGAVPRSSLLRNLPRWGGIALIALLSVLHGGDLWAQWPNLISYYNRTAGGQAGAYRHFRDSNSEWGQYGETGPALLRQAEVEPFELLTATSGPRFGRVAIGVRPLTIPDPEDPTRTRHWLHLCEAVRHVGGAYWLFDVTPEEFERIVSKTDDERVRVDLAVAYLGDGRLEDARRHIELLPEDRARPLRTLLDLRERQLAGPVDVPTMLALLAGLIEVGRFDVVVKTIAADPDHAAREHPRLPLLLATALCGQERTEEAIAVLEQGGEPALPASALLLASLYHETQRFGDAIDLLERWREQAPELDGQLVRETLAMLRRKQQEWDSYQKALR
jgi:4-amino-4-deoxy-L-arabinose transferase-like glycosyltransferase